MRSQDSAVVVAPPTPSPARLAAYLAAGVGSSMLATAEVEAGVVAIDLTNVGGRNITGVCAGMNFGDSRIQILNWLGAAGTGTLNIYRQSGQIGLDGSSGLFLAVNGSAYASPRNFGAGASIDASATFTTYYKRPPFRYGVISGSTSPDFGAGSFMGFRFGSGSTWNYGYIEVLWTWTGTQSTSTFQLLSAAYESTANTAILAGAPPTPIPAPSALALLALGGGAFRRARQRAA